MNRILFSLLFLFALLNAESQSDEPVSLTGAGPSAFIHNVNVITGDLVEVVDILEFKGTMPLKVQEVLTRFNAAPYKVDEKAHVKKHANNRVDCVYTNPGKLKAILSPEGRGLDWGEFRLNMELPENAGLTNQALGIASGQSHPGNILARVGKKADEAEILCGDGTRKIFRKGFSSRKKESVEYDFHHEIRPDGLYFGKRWDTLDGFECRARGEKLWGMVTGGWAQSTKHPGYRKYIADDGRETVLETTCFWDGDPQPWNEWTKWYPTKVIPHNDCPTEYSWINKEGYKYAFLVRKKRADDRLRTFSYDGVNAEIRDKHSKYRTRTIVDHAAWRKQVVRAKFDYDKKGSTWVEDGRGYFRRFNYDQEGYLTGKYWFLNPGDREHLLAKELFTWIKGGTFKGSLAEDAIYDGQNKLIKKTAYRYDKFGNVKTLTLSGAITAPLQKDEQKTFATYSDEGMNLLLSETTGAKRTEYRYKEGTNLLTAKYTVINGGIVERNFYFYNEKSALIGEINDDGVTEESSCLEGVTTRLIKRMQTFENGLPQEIAEYYLDLNSGEEKLLKRVEYELTREGWIKKESIFDADNIFRYCIERKFNAQGKVVWESDALGNKIRHTYLKSGAKIETRTAGVVINYTYDHADRLLSESTDGQYVNTYEVDDCDNRILARDLYGNETRFKYDALGRVVEEILPQIELPEGTFTPVVKKKYDLFGNVTRLRNSRGFLTEKTYNIFGKPFSIHYPDGSFEEFRYNLDGTEKSHRLRTGATFHYSYDALGRKTREELVGPEGELLSTETIEYDRLHMRRKVDSEGVATTYDYDFAGRLCREECCGRITEYGYDTLGRKTWTKIGECCTFEV
ncbi:MAG: hypothetical protein KDK48_03405, partial [Chlamydiia bacterium]|nr:hypothetical protein [Chlamydiia bacterium]